MWVDTRNLRIIEQVSQEHSEDFLSDSLDLDHRFAARLEEIYNNLQVDSIARAVTVVVPEDLPEIVNARLVSGVAKFRGIVFDRNMGASDGTLLNTQVISKTAATCVACVGIHKGLGGTSGVMNEVEHHIVFEFAKDFTKAVIFNAVWSSATACSVTVLPHEFSCDRLPVDSFHRDPYLTGFIQPVFEPFLLRVLGVFDALGARGKSINCALHGLGSDSVPIQNFLAQTHRLSVWIPTKSFQEASLPSFGGALISAGAAGRGGALRVHLIQSGVAPFKHVLDHLVEQSQKHNGKKMEACPSGGSLYSFQGGASDQSTPFQSAKPSKQYVGQGDSSLSSQAAKQRTSPSSVPKSSVGSRRSLRSLGVGEAAAVASDDVSLSDIDEREAAQADVYTSQGDFQEYY